MSEAPVLEIPAAPAEQSISADRSAQNRSTAEVKDRRQPSTSRTIMLGAVALLGGLAAWFVIFSTLLSPLVEARSQTILYSQFREQLALQTAPLGGAIPPGSPVAILNSKKLGLADALVVEGTASGDTAMGPGHKRDTPLPGQIGVSVLYGRGAMFGAPFGRISHAHRGDMIQVTTSQGAFTYSVQGVRRAGDDLPPLLEPGKGRLTLVSDEGVGRLGNWYPDAVVYVDAKLEGDAQQYPAGRPVLVPLAERPSGGDLSSLIGLALALPLCLATAVLLVVARERWSRWGAWLVGVPIILAAAWLVATYGVRLLPNLL